jgi:hypothetical protein
MAQLVKNMDKKQNFAKYGNSLTFWDFPGTDQSSMVMTSQSCSHDDFMFSKGFFSFIDLGTIKKRNFWKTEKSYGNNFGNIVTTSFV